MLDERKPAGPETPEIDLSRLSGPVAWSELKELAERARLLTPGRSATFARSRIYMDEDGLVLAGPPDWNPLQMTLDLGV